MEGGPCRRSLDPGIDVSSEEERYLRRAFHRFALPYLLGIAVVVWAAASLWSGGGTGASPEAVTELHDEVAALRESVADLEGRLAAADAGMATIGKRLAAHERAPRPGTPARSSATCARPAAASTVSRSRSPSRPRRSASMRWRRA